MTDLPRVSTVMPAYNAQATIEAALDSLIAQTVTDWEAVVVDDGSTDETGAIIARYAAADPRIRHLTGPGEGASGARNRGIGAARGQWLSFLDADDWIDPHFMAKMLRALDAEPGYRVAYCGFRRVMPDGSMTDWSIDPRVRDGPFEIFARTCAVAIHCLLIDRAMVVDAGSFDTRLKTCEDWDLWQRLSRAGLRWLMVDAPLSYYRTATGSLTSAGRQMLEDGRQVVFRAFAPDPRVHSPLPEYADGLVTANGLLPDEALAWFALWNLVVGTVQGGDVPILPEMLAPLGHGPDRADGTADAIVQALSVALRVVPARLAARWPEYADAIDRLFTRMGLAWDDPVAERRMRYALDHKLLAYDDLAAPRPLGLTLGLRMSAMAPDVTELAEGQDRLYAYLMNGEDVLGIAEPAALGRFGLFEWVDQMQFPDPSRKAISSFIGALAAPLDIGHATAQHGLTAKPRGRVARLGRKVGGLLGGLVASGRARALGEGAALIARLPDMYPPGGHHHALAVLAIEARALALAQPPVAIAAPSRQTPVEADRNGDRKAFWDSYFAVRDPWNYGSPYEQEKYRLQLALVPDRPIGEALELACAEGHFTALLSERVGHLRATDIARPAVDRARERCAARSNIDFSVLDLSRDPLPQGMDLILCSEVLYYLDDLPELEAVAARLADALAPGGAIVTAHAHIIADDRTRSGFDWSNPFGVKVISQTLAATPGLALDQTIDTELYRIDRFVRVAAGQAPPAPKTQWHEIQAPIEPAVARRIIWNGAPTLRGEAATEFRRTVPVLMYHKVANGGPDALRRYRIGPADFRDQMRWLRSNGYHSVTADQIEWHLVHDTPFAGRPVWITFDDGFADFADHAWPVLHSLDLTAEVFVVTDHVGGHADWDARFGPPAPLMDAATIARLAGEGVFFGSHLATHRAADGLSSHDLAAEMLRSRAMIERWIGWAPTAVAAPYGATDGRFGRLADQCGYTLALGGREGPVDLGDARFDLPRMEVRGDRSLADFIAMMEAAR